MALAAGSGIMYDKAHNNAACVDFAKPSTNAAYNYDYIAEWVNHRSDEIGLQV